MNDSGEDFQLPLKTQDLKVTNIYISTICFPFSFNVCYLCMYVMYVFYVCMLLYMYVCIYVCMYVIYMY